MIINSHNSSYFNSKVKKVFSPKTTESLRYDRRKTSQDKIHEYPDYFQSHRKHVMSDYHQKLEQIRLIKVKLTGKNKDSVAKMKNGRRTKTQRSMRDHNPLLENSGAFLSELASNMEKQSFKVNTLKMTHKLGQANVYTQNDHKTSQSISPFQKNTLKRLRARQELSTKKKMISQQIYNQGLKMPNYQIHRNPQSFKIFSENM